jgi:hypothetical protein
MQTASLLRLNPSQVTQLIAFCEAYRSHLWRHLPPTPERNQAIRSMQALEAKLEQAQDKGTGDICLPFSQREKNTMQQQLFSLLQAYGSEPETEARNQKLEEIVNLRLTLNHLLQSFPTG